MFTLGTGGGGGGGAGTNTAARGFRPRVTGVPIAPHGDTLSRREAVSGSLLSESSWHNRCRATQSKMRRLEPARTGGTVAGRFASDSTDVGRVDRPATALEESAEDALEALDPEEAMPKREWSR